jgi:hypothetical protein
MPVHPSKSEKPKSQSAAAVITSSKESAVPEFSDQRPEALSQKGLSQIANNSPQIKQLQAIQEGADKSEQQQKANYFQELANGDSPVVQRQVSPSGNVIQMGGPVKDDLRTPHKKWANSSNSLRDAKRRRKGKGNNQNLHKGPKGEEPSGYADPPPEHAEVAAPDPFAKFRTAMGKLVEKDFKHIMVAKHAWDKVIDGMVPSTEEGAGSYDAASWAKVSAIMWDVIQTGDTSVYKGQGPNAAQKKSKQVGAKTVEVTFIEIKKGEGDSVIRISDAWVVTR